MRLCILSDYDSRIKWGLSVVYSISLYFDSDQIEVSLCYKSFDAECVVYYGIEVNKFIKYKKYQDILSLLFDFDVVILALGGGLITKVMHHINIFDKKRPIVITGFNGLTDPYDPYGLLCRYGADIICINSLTDYRHYSSVLENLGLSNDSLILAGMQRSYIGVYNVDCAATLRWNDSILFVEQIGIPKTRNQLRYLINKLIYIASLNPNRAVLIKCRENIGYKTVNSSKIHLRFRDVWDDVAINYPDNIVFVDDSIERLLLQCTLCISFTSSAIIEALLLNKKVAVISDFGISRQLGNHVFIGSGLLVTLDDIARNKIPEVNLQWYQNNCSPGQAGGLGDRILKLMNNGIRNKLLIYFNTNNYPYYFSERENNSIKFKTFLLSKIRRCNKWLRLLCQY